jgi:hypothetical protein
VRRSAKLVASQATKSRSTASGREALSRTQIADSTGYGGIHRALNNVADNPPHCAGRIGVLIESAQAISRRQWARDSQAHSRPQHGNETFSVGIRQLGKGLDHSGQWVASLSFS